VEKLGQGLHKGYVGVRSYRYRAVVKFIPGGRLGGGGMEDATG
jgi:hypothetical protein